MSKRELDAAIFHSKKEKDKPKPRKTKFVETVDGVTTDTGEVLGFDMAGQWTPDESIAVCKRITYKNNKVNFFVKFCMSGPDNGRMLNPYSMYYRPGDDVKEHSKYGRKKYEFRPVTEKAFINYINFLQYRITGYLREAEREVLNNG